jgi:DNA-binding transcriptional LysR family regulator
MHYRKLDLNLLVLFRALCDERSVTAAAIKLNMSQSAVSHGLARLRTYFSDTLFVRAGSRMEPTARAHEIDQHIRRAFVSIDAGMERGFDPSKLSAIFKVALVNFAGLYVVPALLGKLASEAPNVKINIEHRPANAALAQLRRGEIDLICGEVSVNNQKVRSDRLLTDRYCIVASARNHQVGKQLSIKDLNLLPHVDAQLSSTFEAGLREKGVKRTVSVKADNLLTVLFVVSRGQHVAIVPETVAKIYSDTYKLKRLPLPFKFRPLHIDLVYRNSERNVEAHAWLRDSIAAIAEEIGSTFQTSGKR